MPTNFPAPKKPGYVCPTTGRVAVLVSDLAESDLNGDAPAYYYDEVADDMGLEAWRLVEGIDPHVKGGSFDVCFASGCYKTVGPQMTVFLSASDAARLAAEIPATHTGKAG